MSTNIKMTGLPASERDAKAGVFEVFGYEPMPRLTGGGGSHVTFAVARTVEGAKRAADCRIKNMRAEAVSEWESGGVQASGQPMLRRKVMWFDEYEHYQAIEWQMLAEEEDEGR